MMSPPSESSLHAYLAGRGRDDRGRTLDAVLAFSDADLERVHDYVQWLFPLPTRSLAQPGAPVLAAADIKAIRADPQAVANLHRAAERMLRFYENTSWWLAASDHNHLRITRILRSLRLLVGEDAAHGFYERVMARHRAAGAPISPMNLAYWAEALAD